MTIENTETWEYVAYTEGRLYEGYAHGTVAGQPVCWGISPKVMARHAGAAVIELPRRCETRIVDDAMDAGFAEPMTLERRLGFWSARGARIGQVLANGSIEWTTSALDVQITRAYIGA